MSRMKVRLEGYDDPQAQKILCWREANNSRRNFRATEEAAAGAARIVNPVLQPHDGPEVVVGNAIFECRRVGFHSLPETGQTSVPVPIDFRAHCCGPILVKDPMHRELS